MQERTNDKSRDEHLENIPEKASVGGAFNTGVTSNDPHEKDEIEKKASLANLNKNQQNRNDLTKEDIPDSTNESEGKMGSGQRQDSN